MNLFLQSQRVRIATNVSTPLMVWSSWCFAFSTKMGTYDVFMNGQRITNGSWIPMRKVGGKGRGGKEKVVGSL